MPEAKAFLFGIVVAAAVGPIALLIISNALQRGLIVGVGSGVGAALADFTYGLVALFGGAALAPLLTSNEATIARVGAFILIGFGLFMLYKAITAGPALPSDAASSTRSAGKALLTVYALTVVNPLTVLIFLGFTATLMTDLPAARLLVVALCLFAGSLLVQLAFALAGSALRRWFGKPGIVKVLNAASGTGVVLFGLAGLR
jgi:threonine/homoserine/homoserine lactone efflux protein